MKKGILIDVVNETITEVEVGDYKDIQKKIGCQLFDVVSVDDDNDVYVDDEGLLSIDDDSKFFGFKGSNVKFGGNGLVLGINHNNGESKNTTLTVEYLKERIEFFTFLTITSYLQTKNYLIQIGMY